MDPGIASRAEESRAVGASHVFGPFGARHGTDPWEPLAALHAVFPALHAVWGSVWPQKVVFRATEGSLRAMEGSLGVTEGSLGVTEGSLGATEGSLRATEGSLGVTEGSLGATEGSLGATEGSLGATEGSLRAMEGSLGAMEGALGVTEGSLRAMDGSLGTTEGSLRVTEGWVFGGVTLGTDHGARTSGSSQAMPHSTTGQRRPPHQPHRPVGRQPLRCDRDPEKPVAEGTPGFRSRCQASHIHQPGWIGERGAHVSRQPGNDPPERQDLTAVA
jgi:hypothetical protein